MRVERIFYEPEMFRKYDHSDKCSEFPSCREGIRTSCGNEARFDSCNENGCERCATIASDFRPVLPADYSHRADSGL